MGRGRREATSGCRLHLFVTLTNEKLAISGLCSFYTNFASRACFFKVILFLTLNSLFPFFPDFFRFLFLFSPSFLLLWARAGEECHGDGRATGPCTNAGAGRAEPGLSYCGVSQPGGGERQGEKEKKKRKRKTRAHADPVKSDLSISHSIFFLSRCVCPRCCRVRGRLRWP